MTKEQKQKLDSVLKNNTDWPIIVEGATPNNFNNNVVLLANTPSKDLGVYPSENGLEFPLWLKNLVEQSKTEHTFLVVDGMDCVDQNQQNLFYGILKQKGVNGYKFAKNVQIVLTVASGGSEKLSHKIKSLALIHRVV